MLNFDFLEKVLGITSLPHFVYDFSRKMFLMLQRWIQWKHHLVEMGYLLLLLLLLVLFLSSLSLLLLLLLLLLSSLISSLSLLSLLLY